MSKADNTNLNCPVIVLTLQPTQILGDELADVLRDQMLAGAVSTQCQNVVLDFHKVTFLSSAGFRPLLSLHRLLRQQQGRLILCCLSPEVHEIFEVTRLISTKGQTRAPFEVQPDVPTAVASLYKPASGEPIAP
jgi:anti-anti-sigma factor